MITKITKMRAGGVTVHFGTDKVVRYTEIFPCRVWRVVVTSEGVEQHQEIKRIALTTRPDRRMSVREAAVREAGKGWQAGAKAQWVEVRPDDWRPSGWALTVPVAENV